MLLRVRQGKGHKDRVAPLSPIALDLLREWWRATHPKDAKHNLIVAIEVTNEATDRNWLSPMAVAAKETLQTDSLVVVADKGYSSAREVEACLEANITRTCPNQKHQPTARWDSSRRMIFVMTASEISMSAQPERSSPSGMARARRDATFAITVPTHAGTVRCGHNARGTHSRVASRDRRMNMCSKK
jgi:hypothetical protein